MERGERENSPSSINELIRKNLSLTGHHCTQAFDGLSAVECTPKEYELLEVLIRNRNIALSRERLLEMNCQGRFLDMTGRS